jgi:formylglycine-generating enzyme required for sulfatase activity
MGRFERGSMMTIVLLGGGALSLLTAAAIAAAPIATPAPAPAATPAAAAEPAAPLAPFAERVAEAAASIDMVPVPGTGDTPSFWISRTEIPWEIYDVFVYRLDVALEDEAAMWADTTSRPSKPYLPPDRGFGHQGYATISVTHHAVSKFCEWLSERTGRTYRLPTEDEWERAARMRPDGTLGEGPYANDVTLENLGDIAWFKGNARNRPHPIGRRTPTPLGLHDMHGNVAEWVNGRDGSPTTKGGSYRDTPKNLRIDASADQTSAWNSSDPQIPKSTWWLSDGPMIGFRIVCEVPAGAAPAAATTNDTPAGDDGEAGRPSASPSPTDIQEPVR